MSVGFQDIHKATRLELVQAPLAAGTSDPNSSHVDMSGFESVRFIGVLGTATGAAAGTLAVEGSASTGSTTFVALSGATVTSTTGQSDALLAVSVVKVPDEYRYLRTALTRATANLEYGGTIAEMYGAKTMATTDSGTVHASVSKISPTS